MKFVLKVIEVIWYWKAEEKEIFVEYMQSFLSVKIFNGSLVFTVNIKNTKDCINTNLDEDGSRTKYDKIF